MFVVLTYDISSKKRAKIEKTCEKYLHHIQKSVFDGEISYSNLKRLKASLLNLIDTRIDSIIIFRSEYPAITIKEMIGNCIQQNENNIY